VRAETERTEPRPRLVVAYFVANALFAAGLFAHAFLYNFYLDALGLGEGVMGVAAAALTAGGLAALIPAGLVTDRLGPAKTFLLASAVCATGLAAGGVVATRSGVYAAAAVAGMGAAAWRVAMGPLLLRLAPGRLRSRVFSWNVALLVGSGAAWTAIAGSVPGWIEQTTGLGGAPAIRGALLAGAVLTGLSAVVFLPVSRALRAARTERPTTVRPSLSELRIPPVLAAGVLAVFLWMVAGGLVIPFFNLYFSRVHALPVDRIGALFAVAQAFTAVALVASGEAAGRLGARRVLAAWSLLFAPVLWLLPLADALPLALALFFVQGLVPPATNPLIDQVLLERAPAGRHGAVSSWRNAATETSGLVGAALGGFLLERQSFTVLFVTAASVAAAGALALVVWLRAHSGQTPPSPPARTETRRRMMR
jgi:MFS family permease